MKKITLYTDGACLGNPGPGGYAAILLFRNQRKEISGGYRLTTNNRMELMAAISGLESLVESCEVTLYSDSTYLVDSISKGWVERWKTKNWMRNSKNKVVNADLWKRYLNESGKHRRGTREIGKTNARTIFPFWPRGVPTCRRMRGIWRDPNRPRFFENATGTIREHAEEIFN